MMGRGMMTSDGNGRVKFSGSVFFSEALHGMYPYLL